MKNVRLLKQGNSSYFLFQVSIRVISLGLVGLGTVVIAGWLFGIDGLKGILPGLPTMKVNTAVCLMLGGGSLGFAQLTTLPQLRRWRWPCRWLSLCMAGLMLWLGGATLLEYRWEVDLGIDQWVLPQPELPGSLAAPGRMAPNTAGSFIIFGTALVLLHYPIAWWATQVLTLLGGLIGFIALLGYLYGAITFYGVGSATGMAIHTSLGCLALSLGILCLFPRQGWLALVMGPQLGSALLRRLLPFIVVVQPIIWGLVESGRQQNYYSANETGAIASTVNILFLSAIVTWNARQLNRINEKEVKTTQSLERAKQHLEDSQRRTKVLLENMPVGIVQTTMAGQCQYVNQRWSDMTGLTLEQALGDGWITAIHPEDREALLAEWQQSADAYRPIALAYRFLKSDGQEVWVQGNTVALHNETDQVIGYLSSTLDISERRQAEMTTQALIQAIPDYLARMERDGLQKEVFNQNATRTINPSQSQRAVNILDLIPSAIAQERIDLAAAAISTGQLQTQVSTFHFNGVLRHEEARITRLNSQEVLVMVRDITEQVKTERTLRESEATKRALINAIPDKMMRIRQDGIYTDVVNKDNTSANILRPKASVRGCHITDALPAELATERMAYVHQALATGQAQQHEYQIEVQGRLYDEEARLIPLDETSVLVVIRDITEQKQKEKAVEQARHDAEAANRAKSEFLANMSHEIRTPMNAVLGFTELLQPIVSDAVARDYLRAISSSGKTLLALINDILDLSKIEAGRLELYPEPIQIRALVQDICAIFSQKAMDKGVALQGEVADAVPHYLLIDEVRLRQILFNVMGNALKFTETGQVDIQVNLCPQEPSIANQICLQIKVRDTGIGIAPEQRDCIFDAFTQSQGQNNRKFGGTGLGLAITRRLVGLMQGRIHLTSTLGQGSTFTFLFPQVEIPADGDVTVVSETIDINLNQFAPARLLIVDDIASNRNLLAGYFRKTLHTTAFAENGEEAVRLALAWQPDVILMDLRMPLMDGLEAARHIKATESTEHIPIVIVTASCQIQDEIILRDLCEGFIRKPVSRSSLVAALKPVLAFSAPQIEEEPSAPSVPESASTAIAILSPEQHQALTQQLQSLSVSLWEPLQKTLSVEELEAFVAALNQIASEIPYPPLVQYAQTLNQQLEDFNWTSLPQTVADFEALQQALKANRST